MGCNCRNKNTDNEKALAAQRLVESKRTQLRDLRAKEQARQNATKK